MVRLLSAWCMLLVLPCLVITESRIDRESARVGGSMITFAGRTVHGGWCECGTPGCICDPDELPPGGGYIADTSNDTDEGSISSHPATSFHDESSNGSNLLLAFLYWLGLI